MAKLLLNQYQKPVRLIIRSWDYVVGYPLIILGSCSWWLRHRVFRGFSPLYPRFSPPQCEIGYWIGI